MEKRVRIRTESRVPISGARKSSSEPQMEIKS